MWVGIFALARAKIYAVKMQRGKPNRHLIMTGREHKMNEPIENHTNITNVLCQDVKRRNHFVVMLIILTIVPFGFLILKSVSQSRGKK